MSYYRTAWIYCDGEDCPLGGDAAVDLECGTAKEARKQLKANGWIKRRALDYCPECTPVEKGQTS